MPGTTSAGAPPAPGMLPANSFGSGYAKHSEPQFREAVEEDVLIRLYEAQDADD